MSARVVADKSALTLHPEIRKTVDQYSRVLTDEHPGYVALHKSGFTHDSVVHKEGVFVSGDVHTQTIENFSMLVKNGIRGVYHSVSPKHLQGYLNEYVWRYNHRDDDASMFLNPILRAAGA